MKSSTKLCSVILVCAAVAVNASRGDGLALLKRLDKAVEKDNNAGSLGPRAMSIEPRAPAPPPSRESLAYQVPPSCEDQCQPFVLLTQSCSSTSADANKQLGCQCNNVHFNAFIQCVKCLPQDMAAYAGDLRGLIDADAAKCIAAGLPVTVDTSSLPSAPVASSTNTTQAGQPAGPLGAGTNGTVLAGASGTASASNGTILPSGPANATAPGQTPPAPSGGATKQTVFSGLGTASLISGALMYSILY